MFKNTQKTLKSITIEVKTEFNRKSYWKSKSSPSNKTLSLTRCGQTVHYNRLKKLRNSYSKGCAYNTLYNLLRYFIPHAWFVMNVYSRLITLICNHMIITHYLVEGGNFRLVGIFFSFGKLHSGI